MNRLSLIFGLALALLCFTAAIAAPPKEEPEVVTVPLDQIWAYRMPGTRDILKLEPGQNEAAGKGLWNSIVVSLLADVSPDWPLKGQVGRPGFAVSGRGPTALRETHVVFSKGGKPSDTFTTDDDITLVFFSYQCGALIHLQNVERRGNVIDMQYRVASPIERVLAAHLALIPVGKLPVGHYDVKSERGSVAQELLGGRYIPMDKDPRYQAFAKGIADRFVCPSFSFEVVECKAE